MSTSVTEHVYELEPHIKVARARAGVLLLIISDALSVLAILAAGGYLSALNTEGLFMAKGDHPPAFVPGLVVAILIVVSGICYYLWERRERQGADSGPRAVFILSCALMIVALAVQVWITRILGFSTTPFNAYESLITLITWYSVFHFLLAAIIGLLLLGRVLRGRREGHDYIVEVVGYWWYYTVIASLVLWVFGMVLS
jgi:heme/copper-type cytochrome/quinol oxidase subunit 2